MPFQRAETGDNDLRFAILSVPHSLSMCSVQIHCHFSIPKPPSKSLGIVPPSPMAPKPSSDRRLPRHSRRQWRSRNRLARRAPRLADQPVQLRLCAHAPLGRHPQPPLRRSHYCCEGGTRFRDLLFLARRLTRPNISPIK